MPRSSLVALSLPFVPCLAGLALSVRRFRAEEPVAGLAFCLGGVLLMGADVTPERYEESKGFTLSLHMNDTAEAERIFNALAGDGRIVLPLEKTFWAAKFGMVVDRFGTPWTINCDA